MSKFQSYLPNALKFYKFWKIDVKLRSNREYESHLLTSREMCDILLLAGEKNKWSSAPCDVRSTFAPKSDFVYTLARSRWMKIQVWYFGTGKEIPISYQNASYFIAYGQVHFPTFVPAELRRRVKCNFMQPYRAMNENLQMENFGYN